MASGLLGGGGMEPWQMGLLGAGAGMLQGHGFRQGMGNAMQGFMQGNQAGMDMQMRQQQAQQQAELFKLKKNEAERLRAERQRQTEFFQNLSAPTSQGAEGPPHMRGQPGPSRGEQLGMSPEIQQMLQTSFEAGGPEAAGDLFNKYTMEQSRAFKPQEPEIFGDKDNGYFLHDYRSGETRRLGPTAAAIARANAEGVGLNQKDRLTAQGAMRKEIAADSRAKNFKAAEPLYKAAVAAAQRNDRVADVDLVYAIAKIFDPTSVVRESEFSLVLAADKYPPWLMEAASKVSGGTGRLRTDVRQKLLYAARDRVQTYREPYQQLVDDYTNFAKRGGLDVNSIVPTVGGDLEMPTLRADSFFGTGGGPAAGAPDYPGAAGLDEQYGGAP